MSQLAAGDTFKGGEYELRSIIGQGGSATIYRAYSRSRNEEVALKVFDSSHAAAVVDDAVLSLEHPNLLTITESGRDNGAMYQVTPLAAQGSLKGRMLKLGQLHGIAETARLVAGVAAGLEHLHERGLVHCDVKPSNILLTDSDWPLLSDFGSVRRIDAAEQHAPITGTPAYMSPEQCRGEAAGARSDEYALAATAYELLTGRKPFRAQTVQEAKALHSTDDLIPPHFLNPKITLELEAVLFRALSIDPKNRFATVLDFSDAFAAAANQTSAAFTQRAMIIAAVLGLPDLLLLPQFSLSNIVLPPVIALLLLGVLVSVRLFFNERLGDWARAVVWPLAVDSSASATLRREQHRRYATGIISTVLADSIVLVAGALLLSASAIAWLGGYWGQSLASFVVSGAVVGAWVLMLRRLWHIGGTLAAFAGMVIGYPLLAALPMLEASSIAPAFRLALGIELVLALLLVKDDLSTLIAQMAARWLSGTGLGSTVEASAQVARFSDSLAGRLMVLLTIAGITASGGNVSFGLGVVLSAMIFVFVKCLHELRRIEGSSRMVGQRSELAEAIMLRENPAL